MNKILEVVGVEAPNNEQIRRLLAAEFTSYNRGSKATASFKLADHCHGIIIGTWSGIEKLVLPKGAVTALLVSENSVLVLDPGNRVAFYA